jgi:putative nucleotidyltransferase with HDIG domain
VLRPVKKAPASHGIELGRERKTSRRGSREQYARFGILALLTIALTTLYPTGQTYEITWFEDSTVAVEEVIAPTSFYIHKGSSEYGVEIAEAQVGVNPVFFLNARVPIERKSAVQALFRDIEALRVSDLPDSARTARLKINHPEVSPISESTLGFLLNVEALPPDGLDSLGALTQSLLDVSYEVGLIESHTQIDVSTDSLTLVSTSDERTTPLDQVRDLDQLSGHLQERILESLSPEATRRIHGTYELVASFLQPNLTYSERETETRRRKAVNEVSKFKGTVLNGERIIDAHERVTSDHLDKLRSLVLHLNQERQQDPYLPTLQTVGRFVISGVMVATLFVFLGLFRESIYTTPNFILFGILVLIPAVVAHYAAEVSIITPFLVPIALSAMIATVLFDAEIGFVVSVVAAVICSSILGSLQHSVVFMVTGAVGAFAVRNVMNRGDFYRSIAFISVAYLLTILATGILFFNYATLEDFVQRAQWDVIFGIFTSCGSAILAIGLLPIFESTFNVITSITLLELSDLNRPLLRNLAIRAPGTYSHSIIMAGLSEAAAEAIGADPLLSRVGCYYHDIGKMIRPHYFIENQKGVNPHDELQPRMSALILISHVKEGVELAREEGLPRAIIDIIPQHHGTGEIASFKHRALERGDKHAVRDEDFRYPGPKPQTKEAGIINLADAIESATRTIPGNAPDQIKGMVQTIIKDRFTAGELDECDLTLRDLTRIQEAFMPILEATRHTRVAYPWQLEQQTQRAKRKQERA